MLGSPRQRPPAVESRPDSPPPGGRPEGLGMFPSKSLSQLRNFYENTWFFLTMKVRTGSVILLLSFKGIVRIGGSEGKASAHSAGDPGWIPDWEDPLEKEMATHSSILIGKTPWREEPGGLQSMGSQRVGHDWATSLSLKGISPLRWCFCFLWSKNYNM